ncbi:MAG TPA: 50S ribosome-binding GTPase, partial [Phycisphaerae bacterium]|nr:50S ribosome-binding GTPase [Phycisphaerae bacterium]
MRRCLAYKHGKPARTRQVTMAHHDDQLAKLADPHTRAALGGAALGWSVRDAHACSALRFLHHATDAPAVIGLVGGASSGKSTIFNALVGRELSAISAHAHETLGPIVAATPDGVEGVRQWMAADLLFAEYRAEAFTEGQPTTGSADAVHLAAHAGSELANVVLCDLPDVTSRSAADEGAVTRSLLPYFDALIVVVDEERWFDAAIFEDFLATARNYGPRVFIVFNRTEQAPALGAEERERVAGVAEQNGASGHCVSEFQPGSGYRPVTDATRHALLEWIRAKAHPDRRKALANHLAQRASAVIAENVSRAERYDALQRAVHNELAQIARDTSLTLDLLTPDERGFLGLGHRFVPLYDLARQVGRRLGGLMGRKAAGEVEFDKRQDALAETLRHNLEIRFGRATARIDEQVAANDYLPAAAAWQNQWSPPPIDANEWGRRIRAHIDAWRDEAKAQSRQGDIAAMSIGTPLLVADLLFLGGAGFTVAWVAASV